MKIGTCILRVSCGAALWLGLSMSALYAQTTGTISGEAIDPSGARVQGVNVTLRSVDTGAVRTSVTDAEGEYIFNLVLPQTY